MRTHILTTAAASLLALAPHAQGPVHGITISTHGSGQDWGTDRMVGTMEDIRETGASWVATHPYAWIRNDGQVRFRDFDPADPPEALVRPIREAHAAGLKILIKPHIGYWGSKFSWRGDIEFQDATEDERFWTTYDDWIVKCAAACKDADAFAVGTELDKMLDEKRWRGVIERIRARTEAPLTYAANWTDYQKVEFWDALDAIGVQAYFPVSQEPTADEAKLRAGWQERMRELHDYSERQDRHVVFTELGYNRAFDAAVEPWKSRVDGRDAETTQQACMRVALDALHDEPRVVGAFLWKWFPGPPSRFHDFQLQNPGMLQVIGDAWKKPR